MRRINAQAAGLLSLRVMPAKAGIQEPPRMVGSLSLDFRLRGNDTEFVRQRDVHSAT